MGLNGCGGGWCHYRDLGTESEGDGSEWRCSVWVLSRGIIHIVVDLGLIKSILHSLFCLSAQFGPIIDLVLIILPNRLGHFSTSRSIYLNPEQKKKRNQIRTSIQKYLKKIMSLILWNLVIIWTEPKYRRYLKLIKYVNIFIYDKGNLDI